jgi:putative membrane protein
MDITGFLSALHRHSRLLATTAIIAVILVISVPQIIRAGLFYSDHGFLQTADTDGLTEVTLSKLAVQRSSDPQVVLFASIVVSDRVKINDQVEAVAAERGVTLPSVPDKKHQEQLDELSRLTGKDFDAAYIKCMTRTHNKALSLFEMAQKETKDFEVKTLATTALPAIKVHVARLDQFNKQP